MGRSYSIRDVDAWDLRRRFNAGDYWYRAVVNREFTQEVVDCVSVDEPEDYGCPDGTVQQEIIYRDDAGREIARVHQFLPPGDEVDGRGLPRLCAGEKPDPKRLFEDGVWYRLKGDTRRRPAF